MIQSLESKTVQPQFTSGKTLKEKIRRHLADKNDVITEQDLKEVIVGVEAMDWDAEAGSSVLAASLQTSTMISSWDVVGDKK